MVPTKVQRIPCPHQTAAAAAAAAAAKSLQLYPTLCDPIDGSPLGSSVSGILQARTLGCHFLLQCMKVKSESEVTQSCLTLSDPMACSLPGSSIHGIFQARVQEWGAIAFSAPDCWGSSKMLHIPHLSGTLRLSPPTSWITRIVSGLFLPWNELQLAFQGQITICPKLFLTFWEKWMILRYKRLCNRERMRWISVHCIEK